MNDFERITQDPAIMGGKPCIRGLRVTVPAAACWLSWAFRSLAMIAVASSV